MSSREARRSRPPPTRRFRVLLLADDDSGHADTVLDHIRGLAASRHDVTIYNPRGIPRALLLDLSLFDAVVIHYSIVLTSSHYLSDWFRERIMRFTGQKIVFVQDEFRWVDRQVAEMQRLGIDVLFSCVPEKALPDVYGSRLEGIEVRPTLTGYVPRRLVGLDVPRISDRRVDVGYRGRTLPYWLGRLAQEKRWIAEGFLEATRGSGLALDIGWAESERIYGPAWSAFLRSCRATLGTESGASIADHDGLAEAAVRSYVATRPEAGFDEVASAVLQPWEGNAVVNTISPRLLEAASFRTALVLFPGEYAGTVEAGRHYLSLEKDFSNVGDIVEALRDHALLQRITDAAYDDLVESGVYGEAVLTSALDAVLDERVIAISRRSRARMAAIERETKLLSRWTALRTRRKPGLLRVVHHRVAHLYRLALLLLLLARHRDLVHYATRPLTSGRTVLSRTTLREVIRMAALREALGTQSLPALEPVLENGALVLKSTPRTASLAPLCPSSLGSARRLVLDHSSVGSELEVTLGGAAFAFSLGPGGRYEFGNLALLARPSLAEAAEILVEPLVPLMTGAPQDR